MNLFCQTRSLSVLFFALLLFQFSCSVPFKTIQIEILEPSEVTIPPEIGRVAILNGVVKSDTDSFKINASKECIFGLADQISYSPRFDTVIIVEDELLHFNNYFIGKIVEEICEYYKVDALIVLDTFDPSSKVSASCNYIYMDDNPFAESYYQCNAYLNLDIRTSWKIYKPDLQILEEYSSNTIEQWAESDEYKEVALSYLPDRHNVTMEYSYYSGIEYGLRICPSWHEVDRIYYSKGNEDMRLAQEHVEKEEWLEAANIWKKYINDKKKKIALWATFNLALAYEMEGILWKARKWALTAYRDFGNEEARVYANTLFNRISRQPKLIEQMKGR